jgi:hypothetical protein
MAKLITYDLRSPGKDYKDLIKAIQTYSSWGKVTESCWVVVSSDSCVTIRDNLKKHTDSNDRIFVATLDGEAAWVNIIGDDDRMKSRLDK